MLNVFAPTIAVLLSTKMSINNSKNTTKFVLKTKKHKELQDLGPSFYSSLLVHPLNSIEQAENSSFTTVFAVHRRVHCSPRPRKRHKMRRWHNNTSECEAVCNYQLCGYATMMERTIRVSKEAISHIYPPDPVNYHNIYAT